MARLLGAEIPNGTSIFMVGPPGAGKTSITIDLSRSLLNRGIPCVYVTLNQDPQEVRANIVGSSRNEKAKDMLVLVDGYSWRWGESNEPYRIKSLTNLNDLTIRFFTACENIGPKLFFVIDSVSNCLIYNSENEVVRLLDVYMAKARASGHIGIFMAEEGIHDPSFYKMLYHMADGVIEVNTKDDDTLTRILRIAKFRGLGHAPSWHKFHIQNGGVVRIAEKVGR
ncbi:MAG: RAD55 family ATPase [Candidatus Bathyarchaeia archaeon]